MKQVGRNLHLRLVYFIIPTALLSPWFSPALINDYPLRRHAVCFWHVALTASATPREAGHSELVRYGNERRGIIK